MDNPLYVPVAGNRRVPSVARNGSHFLVVWADGRNGSESHGDIYGARVSSSGAVLDPAGIAVDLNAGAQRYPAVAAGSNAQSLVVCQGWMYEANRTVVVTVRDNDSSVTVTATDPTAGEPATGQGGGMLTFTRAGFTGRGLTVQFTVSGTATRGSDYTSIGTSVTFAAGATTATKTVSVLDNNTVESNETIIVALTAGTWYTVDMPLSATVTIQDDDAIVTVAATDPTAGEPATSHGSGAFTFTRAGFTGGGLTVQFTVSGMATTGGDYTSIGTSVTFAAGATTATKTVSVLDNNTVESNETVIVTLAAGTGYTVGAPLSATVTIEDDESADVEVIVDNADAMGVVKVGAWVASNYGLGHWPTNYLHDGNAQKGTKSVTFQPNLPANGCYAVFIWYPPQLPADAPWANNVPVDIGAAGGTNTVTLNEKLGGSQWMFLGTNTFVAGTSGYVRVRNGGTINYVIADAVKFVKVSGTFRPLPPSETRSPDMAAISPSETSSSVTETSEERRPWVWTSGEWSEEFGAANLIDGNTNTLWIGNADGNPWRAILDLGVVTDVADVKVLFRDAGWTNMGIAGSRDSEVWFDYLAQTNAWTPLRYLNVNFWSDEHGAHPPAIREIFWRGR